MPPRRNLLFACALSAALCACASPLPSHTSAAAAVSDGVQSRSRGDLLYVGAKHHIEVYAFSSGTLQTTFPSSAVVRAMCSDAAGNVFVAASSSAESGEVDEYARGGSTPIASLQLPAHDVPVGCSSDPTTGDLAVPAYDARDYSPKIAIYPRARGEPDVYRSKALGANPQAAYDDGGDLFATSGGDVGIERRAGKSGFKRIELDVTLGDVGHVQWDGAHWAVQSFGVSRHNHEKIAERIFRFDIAGTGGHLVGRTRFERWPANRAGQSWIAGSTIVASAQQRLAFWHYPAGGRPFATIRPPYPSVAVTVSSAR